MLSLSEIDRVFNVVALRNVGNSAYAAPNNIPYRWNQPVSAGFKPDYAIVRQVTVNSTVAENKDQDPGNVYVLYSSLNANPLITFGAPGTSNPQTVIRMENQEVSNIEFSIAMINTIVPTTFTSQPLTVGPTFTDNWFVAVHIDLVSLKHK